MIDSVTVLEDMPVFTLAKYSDGPFLAKHPGTATRHHVFEGQHLINSARRAARWMRSSKSSKKLPPRHIMLGMVALNRTDEKLFVELAKGMIQSRYGSIAVRLVLKYETL